VSAALQVRPCEAADLVFLKRIGSPLVNGRGKRVSTRDEILEAIYLFTRPKSESAELLKRGRDIFRQTAIRSLENVTSVEAQRLVEQIGNSIIAHKNGVANTLQQITKFANSRGKETWI
jgi:hypothetical protein